MVFKVLGVLAVGVAIFVPLKTSDGQLVFFTSILAGVGCLIAWSVLDDEPGNPSLWPPRKDSK
jgi:hypothetical protein